MEKAEKAEKEGVMAMGGKMVMSATTIRTMPAVTTVAAKAMVAVTM